MNIKPHQLVGYGLARMKAQGAIDTKGLLLYHSTGSGKTLSMLLILLAFWTTDDPIYIVSTRQVIDANNMDTLTDLAIDYCTEFGGRDVIDEDGDDSWERPFAGIKGELL